MLTSASFLLFSCATGGSKDDGTHLPEWTDPNPFANSVNHSFASPESQGQGRLGFLFSAHTMGEIDVCGCALNPKGGVDRRLNYVRKTRLDNPAPITFLDAGNTLFPTETIQKSQIKKFKARADLILNSYSKMLIQGMNVAPLDLSLGVEVLRELADKNKVPLVSSNIVDSSGRLLFQGDIQLKVGNKNILVLGVSGGSEKMSQLGLKTLDPATVIKEKTAQLNPETMVVILSDLGQSKDEILAKDSARPIIVVGSRETFSLEIPLHIGKSLVLRPHFQGQQWSYLELDWKPAARGWYNFFMAQSFQLLWDARLKSYNEVKAKGVKGESEKVEIETIENSRNEMRAYLPGKLKEKIFYRFINTSLTEDFAKPNELTPLIRKLK
jgi:2',3'-cyclic-nucleotide 2'-phosphodiesterase (5'-nucleotidase family)